MTEPNQDALLNILALGQRLDELRREINNKEREVNELKSDFREIEQMRLPAAMDLLGIREITLANGKNIKLDEFPVGRIAKGEEETVFNWLRENHHEGIIKNTFTAQLGTADNDLAAHLSQFLSEHNIQYDAKAAIHPSTFKAFIREMANVEGFPRDLFHIYDVKQVKFTG